MAPAPQGAKGANIVMPTEAHSDGHDAPQAELRPRNPQVAELVSALKTKDARIAELLATIDVNDTRVAAALAELARSEQQVAELREMVDLRDEQIVRLAREVEGLQSSQQARGLIEQAKGVIMSTMQCSADAAFAVLVAQSSLQNRKVREIAAELAALQDRQPPSPRSTR
jgi:uncharacterized protein YdcH (DUF465 family)